MLGGNPSAAPDSYTASLGECGRPGGLPRVRKKRKSQGVGKQRPLALSLVESMTSRLNELDLTDHYRETLREMGGRSQASAVAKAMEEILHGFPHWLALVLPKLGFQTPGMTTWPPWQRLDQKGRAAICDKGREYGPDGYHYQNAEIDLKDWVARVHCEIDWSWSNRNIEKAFRQWLKQSRPPPLRELAGRGHDSLEIRASLERLGLIRLRYCLTFADATKFLARLPRSSKTQNASECNREARKALDDWHRLFPFIPEDEKPRSWPMK